MSAFSPQGDFTHVRDDKGLITQVSRCYAFAETGRLILTAPVVVNLTAKDIRQDWHPDRPPLGNNARADHRACLLDLAEEVHQCRVDNAVTAAEAQS